MPMGPIHGGAKKKDRKRKPAVRSGTAQAKKQPSQQSKAMMDQMASKVVYNIDWIDCIHSRCVSFVLFRILFRILLWILFHILFWILFQNEYFTSIAC